MAPETGERLEELTKNLCDAETDRRPGRRTDQTTGDRRRCQRELNFREQSVDWKRTVPTCLLTD